LNFLRVAREARLALIIGRWETAERIKHDRPVIIALNFCIGISHCPRR
jgi:hypothetical protein